MILISAFRLVTTLGKVISIFDAGRKIHKNLNQQQRTNANNVDIVFQSMFALAQLGDGIGNGLGFIPSSYSHARVGLRIHASMADVTRNITHVNASGRPWSTGDVLNVAANAAFRTGDALNFTAENLPQIFGSNLATASTIANGLEAAGNVTGIISGVVSIDPSQPQHPPAAPRMPEVPQPVVGQPPRNRQEDAQPEMAVQANVRTVPAIVNDEAADDCLAIEIEKFLVNPLASDSIPRTFFPDTNFKYICGISGKPIRYILRPPFTPEQLSAEANLSRICYDKNEFKQWIQSHPRVPPLNWPANIRFEKNNYPISDIKAQKEIDDFLRNLAGRPAVQHPERQSNPRMPPTPALELDPLETFKQNPLGCSEIPDFLDKNAFPYHCAITGKPIRRIFVSPLTQEQINADPSLQDIYYDRDSFLQWCHEHPRQPAPKWPQVVEFIPENRPKHDKRAQLTIDNLLIWLAANIKTRE